MKYIGYYDVEQYKDENRYYPPAGKAKMEYIAGVLAQINDLEIVSASGVNGTKSVDLEQVPWLLLQTPFNRRLLWHQRWIRAIPIAQYTH